MGAINVKDEMSLSLKQCREDVWGMDSKLHTLTSTLQGSASRSGNYSKAPIREEATVVWAPQQIVFITVYFNRLICWDIRSEQLYFLM
jgi:hypothetical protein